MGERLKGIPIAVSVTIFDTVVVRHYGVRIWHALAGVFWFRLMLELLASTGTYSRVDIWAHVLANPVCRHQKGEADLPRLNPPVPTDLLRGTDV